MKRQARHAGAFTLLELLVVIGIIALLATIGISSLRGFTAVNVVQAGNRQLVDDINMARNYAQNQRTTVFMVFLPDFETLQAQGFNLTMLTPEERRQVTNLITGQFTSYNFVTLRTVGDQPGRGRPRYLSPWKNLPDGVFINTNKFVPLTVVDWRSKRDVTGETNLPMTLVPVPFPSPSNTNRWLMPAIAFSYRGDLLGADPKDPNDRRRVDEIITLSRGSIIYERDPSGKLTLRRPELLETPRSNSVYNPRIRIDWLSGRPRIEEVAL